MPITDELKVLKYELKLTSLYDIITGICIPIFVTSILYLPVMLKEGIPFFGDNTYYYVGSKSIYWSFRNTFFLIGTIPLTMFSCFIPLHFLAGVLDPENAVKVFILLICSSPGISAFIAIKMLHKDFLNQSYLRTTISALVGGLFYMLAFSSGIIDGGSAYIWPYLTFPMSLAICVRFTRSGDVRLLFPLALLSILGNTQPIWLYLMMVIGTSGILTGILIPNGKTSLFIKRILTILATIVSSNAFWIVPLIYGYLSKGGGLFSSYVNLLPLSHWNLLDVMIVGEQQHEFFWLHPQNYTLLNVTIPIITAVTILVFHRKRYVLFMAITLVAGIFLTKGVHDPGGYLYFLLAKNLPYGAGAVLRGPSKFVPLVNYSYSSLIGLFASDIHKRTSLDLRMNLPLRHVISVILIVIALSSITYGTFLDLQAYTWPHYEPKRIPQIYDEVNNWLLSKPGNFKVMWIPSGTVYLWKPYLIAAFPDLYSSKPAVYSGKIYPQYLNSTDNITKILKFLGVRYIIYHGDSLDHPNEEILRDLQRQRDLKVVYSSNYTFKPSIHSRDSSLLSYDVKETTVPFIIFENMYYRGPIYASNLTLAYVENPSWVGYEQISPVEWEVTVNASKSFVLVFTEPYDELWRAYIEHDEVKPISVYNMVNGFIINRTGILKIRLYYTLQSYYILGLAISALSVSTMVMLLLIKFKREYVAHGRALKVCKRKCDQIRMGKRPSCEQYKEFL